jgi:hypothetical protein
MNNPVNRRNALLGSGGLLGALTATELLGPAAVAQASTLSGSDLFGPLRHVGFAVARTFDEVQAKLTVGLGTTWRAPVTETLTLRLEHGRVHTYTDRYVLSDCGPPYLELLDAVPGTFFGATPKHPVTEIA